MSNETGRILREWREARKDTQEEAAAIFGVTQATISNWEKGRSPMPMTALGRLENLVRRQKEAERLIRKGGER